SGLAQRTYNLIVASNATVLQSLADLLRNPAYAALGRPVVDEAPFTGDVDAELERHLGQAQELWPRALDDGQPRLLLCGGEGIVRLPPDASGQGGRNQHYALMAARRVADTPWCVFAAGTDGIDGNSPAAGAVVDGTTIRAATGSGLSADGYLARYDSYGFFRRLEERTHQSYLVATGATGTNVNDIVIWWLDPGAAA
ncbi:MAG: MOFRL family protein, partial [Chloroflexota bacterium]